jgi:hypothetical protein
MRRLEGPEISGYDVISPAVAKRVRIVRVPVLAWGADGMTIGPVIFLRRDDDRSGTRAMITHELVHVQQFMELGPCRFLVRYVRDYLSALRRLRNHHQAYLAVPFEAEARNITVEWTRGQSHVNLEVNPM